MNLDDEMLPNQCCRSHRVRNNGVVLRANLFLFLILSLSRAMFEPSRILLRITCGLESPRTIYSYSPFESLPENHDALTVSPPSLPISLPKKDKERHVCIVCPKETLAPENCLLLDSEFLECLKEAPCHAPDNLNGWSPCTCISLNTACLVSPETLDK